MCHLRSSHKNHFSLSVVTFKKESIYLFKKAKEKKKLLLRIERRLADSKSAVITITLQEHMARVGFEPTRLTPTDLESVPLDHSGIWTESELFTRLRAFVYPQWYSKPRPWAHKTHALTAEL